MNQSDLASGVTAAGHLQLNDGLGGDRDALDGALVAAPPDAEEAALAPGGAPAVLDDPVLLARHVTAAVAHQQHGVVGQLEGVVGVHQAGVVVDALLVVHEVRVDLVEEGSIYFKRDLGWLNGVFILLFWTCQSSLEVKVVLKTFFW